MTHQIDLMPRSCREVLGRRTLVRRWVIAYAGAGVCILAGHALTRAGWSSLVQRRDALAAQVRLNWSRNEAVQQLVSEIARVEADVTRYNRLAWPVRASEVIDAVAAVMPEQATIVSLGLTPREEKRPASQPRHTAVAPSPEAAPLQPTTYMVVELEGVSTGDEPVARFVSGLEANPLFSRVSLDYTKSKSVGEVEARAFRVRAEVDLSSKYIFSTAEVQP